MIKLPESDENVGMGDFSVGEGSTVLSALGIGSCVAVCLYNSENDVAALGHVMLPKKEGDNSKKRADVIIEGMIDELADKGVDESSLAAKIFGGASMFGSKDHSIGKENVESVENILQNKDINIEESEIGGNKGRAVWLTCNSGEVVERKFDEGTSKY